MRLQSSVYFFVFILLTGSSEISASSMRNPLLVNSLLESSCFANNQKLCGQFSVTNPSNENVPILISIITASETTEGDDIVLRPECRERSYDKAHTYYNISLKKDMDIPDFVYLNISAPPPENNQKSKLRRIDNSSSTLGNISTRKENPLETYLNDSYDLARGSEEDKTSRSNESFSSVLGTSTVREIEEENSMYPNLKDNNGRTLLREEGSSSGLGNSERREIEEETSNIVFSDFVSGNYGKAAQMDEASSIAVGNSKRRESDMKDVTENYLDADPYNLKNYKSKFAQPSKRNHPEVYKKTFFEENSDFLTNLRYTLRKLKSHGKFFLYELNIFEALATQMRRLNNNDHSASMIKMNIMADFFYLNIYNFRFTPAKELVHRDAFNAWMELEDSLREFLGYVVNDGRQMQYTVLNAFLKSDKDGEPKLTYLMKHIFYHYRSIMFIIPNSTVEEQIGKSKPVCSMTCEENEWSFKSSMLNCCDARKSIKFEKYKMLRQNPFLEFKPLIVYKSKTEVSMLRKKNPFERFHTQIHYFCNDGQRIRIGHLLFPVLTKTSKKKKCLFPVLSNLIPKNFQISGIIIDFSENSTQNKNKGGDSAMDVKLLDERVTNDWEFYTGKEIFDVSNLWFIKISNLEGGKQGYRGYFYKPLVDTSKHDKTFLYYIHYKCGENNGLFTWLNNKIYQKENIIRTFTASIGSTDPVSAKMKLLLRKMWDLNYMQPIPYVSNNITAFKNYESFFSCGTMAIWKDIYSTYRKPVEILARKIISKVNGKALIYTFQYEPLTFENGNIFHLCEENKELEDYTVHRYIVTVIITPKAQIAFVTVNDIFLSESQKEVILHPDDQIRSPFSNNDSFLDEYCKEDCTQLGYQEIVSVSTRMNYCCSFTPDFRNKFSPSLKAGEVVESAVLDDKKL